jgi:hypothetical protein
MRLLLDANVPRYAAVSAYKKIREHTIQWGPIRDITDVVELCPPPYERAPKFFQKNVPFIPALAKFSESATTDVFYTYHLIDMEFWNVRPAFDWANRDIRKIFNCKELPLEIDSSGILLSTFDKGAFPRYLNSFLRRIDDANLSAIVKEMGQNYSRDCIHLWFADRHGLDGLVTMDKDFIGNFNKIRKEFGFRARAYSPMEVARALRISPIGSEWLAARDDPYVFYVDHQPTPIGEYIFDHDEAQKLFAARLNAVSPQGGLTKRKHSEPSDICSS